MAIHPSQWSADLEARYELLEEAGRGGMGVVYKARDRETGEIVALKILKPDIAADRVSAERFLNEVRLSRRITHKNVTRVYEFTRAGTTAYLSMEYVEGESLRSIVQRMGAVNVRKGIQIARQICAALHEAHSQGIVHRDLKPENVMIDKAGNVKVMDFGIARLLDASVTATASGIIGTPAYMAPEQAEGKAVDARTDIYALGLILYEIFTGQAAFTGDTPMVVAIKQIRETPAAPQTVDPSLPWELDAIIMRCLDKAPEERFQTVEELDTALASVASGATTTGSLQMDTPALATGAPTWPTVGRARTTPLASQTKPHAEPATVTTPAPAMRPRRKWLSKKKGLLIAAAVVAALFILDRDADDPIPSESFTLKNGLKVLLVEDDSAPTVAVAVTYNVGAKDDPAGRDGLAHLFEHMMFDGSLNVGNGEHLYLVTREGGVTNGTTQMDHTQVWQTLPSNQLELALFLEADRMRSLRMDQARLEAERGTVIAERQQRIENQPYGRAAEALSSLAFDIPAYRKTHLGSEAGLRAIDVNQLQDFFRVFYAPNNAVLVIAGSFDADKARALVEKYFEHIPAQPPAPDIDLSEPAQAAERRGRVEDPFAASPRLYVGYKIPPGTSEETEALMVLTSVLGETAASRLHQRLVRETEVSTGVSGGIDARKGPGLMTFTVTLAADRDEAAALATFDEVIAQVRDGGVTDDEVRRARMRLRLGRVAQLQQNAQRALMLGEYQVRFGSADLANRRLERLEEIDADDVNRVAREHLRPERRSILTVVRGGTATPTFKADATQAGGREIARSERLNRAPVSKDVLRVRLPEARETTLDNGLTVLIAHNDRAPLVSMRMEFRGAGSLHAPAGNPAVAIATGAMLREGTSSRSSRQIAEEFDALGVSLSSGQTTDSGAIFVQATGLSETFEQWFPAVADAILRASFPPDELNLMKRRLAAEWQQRASAPLTVASEAFDEAVYGPVAGRRLRAGDFAKVTSDQLRAWHRERYVPQNTILSLAGALDRRKGLETVRQAVAGWARTSFAEPATTAQPPAAARVFIVDRPGSVQTTLMLGVAGPSHGDAEYLPLVVANRVLGGGPASRLFVKLRDERGLTFSTYSLVSAFRNLGDWRAYAEISAPRAAEGVDAMLGELRAITAQAVPQQELDDAKRSIVASFAVTLEQVNQVVNYIATRRSYGLSSDYWTQYPAKVMAVDAADTQKAAAKYMDFGRLQVIAIGDAAQLEPIFKPYGTVSVIR